MRAYFKNDLYNFAAQRDKERQFSKRRQEQQKEALLKKQKDQKKKKQQAGKPKDQRQDSRTISKPIRKVDDNLSINIDDMKKDNKPLISQDLESMEQLLKSVSKKKDSNRQNKNIFSNGYKPKSSLVVKEEIKEPKTQKQERKQRINQYVSYKKMESQIRKAATQEEQKDPSQSKKAEEKVQSADEQSKQVQTKKGRTKMIKKQANYQRLDLKRKYKDRFLGGLHSNLKKFTRNGRLRPKYRAQSQLTLEDGQLYNSYISSLSSALVMTLNIHDDSDNDCQSSSQSQSQINQWITPESLTKDKLTTCIQKYFGFQNFRQGQYETIQNIINGRSTIFISETASGKSLTYILSSMILKGLSIVISPLVSLMLDQLAHLPKELPAACISSLINREQKERIINMVKQGKINLLFLTPQCLQTDFVYNLEDFPQVNFTCIDEAHSLSQLSHNFRTSFLALGDIVLNMIKYKNNKPTILGLTATANPETVDSIKQKLEIKETIRSSNCMNKNLFVTISRQKGALKYQSLIRYLNDSLICQCKGILVYTRTRKIMGEVFNYITNSVSSTAAIYHSALSNKEKTETLKKFRQGSIKIVVATVALGMGLDFSNLQCVIHLNMPKSIENYVQQIGRAGRRERRAYCHLFLDQNDYITERNYIIADEIQPCLLQLIYDYLMQNSTFKSTKKVHQKISKMDEKLAEEQVIKRAAIIMQQCQRQEQIIYEEDEEQLDSDQSNQMAQIELKKVNTRLFSIRVEKLKQKTQLRQQAILTLLLKIESLLKTDDQVRLKVMPVSNQLIKVGFFKKNQEEIKQSEPFFKNLIYGCKRVKGNIYINLIDKCNELSLKPIQLLTKLYRISHKYTVKVQLQTPIFVWQFQGRKTDADGGIQYQLSQLVQRGFQKLMSKEYINRVISEMNDVQRVSLVKLNVLWSLTFLHSRNHILNILQNNRLLPRSQPIPIGAIPKQFDNYFKQNLQQFYNKLTNGGAQIFIPTTMVDKKDIQEIYGSIELFLRHEMANQGQLSTNEQIVQARKKIVSKYQDGKVLTKILMGVNSGEVSWKIYGERKYWMTLKLKNYNQLLQAVREGFERYKQFYFN